MVLARTPVLETGIARVRSEDEQRRALRDGVSATTSRYLKGVDLAAFPWDVDLRAPVRVSQ